ncbi:hypothetical protein ACU4GD_29935 [Cupriavidus basilensis]
MARYALLLLGLEKISGCSAVAEDGAGVSDDGLRRPARPAAAVREVRTELRDGFRWSACSFVKRKG